MTASTRGRVVARAHTDHAGHFRIVLPAGRYLVRAVAPGPLASTAARSITVTAGDGAVKVTLVVDSGIR